MSHAHVGGTQHRSLCQPTCQANDTPLLKQPAEGTGWHVAVAVIMAVCGFRLIWKELEGQLSCSTCCMYLQPLSSASMQAWAAVGATIYILAATLQFGPEGPICACHSPLKSRAGAAAWHLATAQRAVSSGHCELLCSCPHK